MLIIRVCFILYYLKLTGTNGFYAIPLNEINLNLKTSSLKYSKLVKKLLSIENTEEKSKNEKKYIASRLHQQFEHPPGASLIDLIKTAGISDQDLLDMVEDLDKVVRYAWDTKDQVQDQWGWFSLGCAFNETELWI